jgi:hypothetical protein
MTSSHHHQLPVVFPKLISQSPCIAASAHASISDPTLSPELLILQENPHKIVRINNTFVINEWE